MPRLFLPFASSTDKNKGLVTSVLNINTPCPFTGNDLPHMHVIGIFRISLVIGVLPIPNPTNELCVVIRRFVY